MEIEIEEKNTVRAFPYSTAVQEITLLGLMFFSSKKGSANNLNQNLRMHEEAFDNFNCKADEDIADI